MHIHELNPWRTLIVVLIFVAIIIIGFVTMKQPLLSYNLTMEQSVEELINADAYFYPWELDGVLSNETDSIILFDIRNNFVFGQGHIPGAENLSASNLTNEENIERLEELKEKGFTVVLYGEDELQANGPWMFFRQVGFDNIKLLLGGYNYFKEHKNDLYSTVDDDAYLKGIPRYNYAEKAAPKEGIAIDNSSNKKPIQVKRRKKKVVAAGGC